MRKRLSLIMVSEKVMNLKVKDGGCKFRVVHFNSFG